MVHAVVVLCLLFPVEAKAADVSVSVIYPETAPPYQHVFVEILNGIQAALGDHLQRHAVSESEDPAPLTAALRRDPPQAVITLGRSALNAYQATRMTLPHVVGALDASPQRNPRLSGISLSVDPSVLFAALSRLSPHTQRVYVVYHPDRDQWLIDLATPAAARFGLALVPFTAIDLPSSAKRFWSILNTANPDSDALWLPISSRLIDDQHILPTIIKTSWSRRLIVFSNNLGHADMGVLLAFYPDNAALGQRLANMAIEMAATPALVPGIQPLRDVKSALNVRVANHLGLDVGPQVTRHFDLILGLQ